MLMQPRLLLSLLATLVGIALLCYGMLREVTVLEWKDREISVLIPSLSNFAEQESDLGDVGVEDERRPERKPDSKAESKRSGDGKALRDAVDDVNPFESSPVKMAGGANDAGEEENPFAPKPSPARQPNAPGPPLETIAPPLGLETKVVTETYFEALVLPESAVVRDVTVGGLTRLANGELKRTYSGQPPALCPT